MDSLFIYIAYAILVTITLTAGAAWQITGNERAGFIARTLFFVSTLPFLLIYYFAAVVYLSVRELPPFLKDSFLGVVGILPVNPTISVENPSEIKSAIRKKRSAKDTK